MGNFEIKLTSPAKINLFLEVFNKNQRVLYFFLVRLEYFPGNLFIEFASIKKVLFLCLRYYQKNNL